ncbi:MAG TPA: ABC transporter ATP-binding protein [Acidobacteriota bacterium]|nr:ABC transporter ATP-binding protein [Acidobacteriota bacterium]
MLNMKQVAKVYRTDTVETHALNSIDIQVRAGEFAAIMGPSGCGKTTFLNVAGLLDTFENGSYHLDGQDVSKLSDSQMSRMRNKKIGFIFQSFNLIPDLNVYDNIDVPLRYRKMSSKDRRAAIQQALHTVGLDARTKHLPSQLSGGQQQRVAIARALVGEPKLILADEPTGNLDSQMAAEIMELLITINREGCTIVMVTHDSSISDRAKRRVNLLDGKVVENPIEAQAPIMDVAELAGV